MHIINRCMTAALLTGITAAFAFPAHARAAADETRIETTVITATRTDTAIKDAPGAVTVVTAEDIRDMAANDILDIVRESAGVSLIGRGVGGRSVISLRGLESQQTLILVDGRRVAASDPVFGHSDFEQNWVPIESIERIEVVRGPQSALYGSEAMGGVINIITRKSTGEWNGSVRVGGGLADDGNGGVRQQYGANIAGPLIGNKLGLSLSAEYLYDEDIPDEDMPAYTEIEEKEATSVNAGMRFSLNDNHTLTFDINVVQDDRNRNTVSRGTDYEDCYALDKIIYGLGWQGTTGPVQSRVSVYRSDIDKDSIKIYETGTVTLNPEKLTNDVLEAQSTFATGRHLWTFGGELRKEELASSSLRSGEDSVTHQAWFGQDEFSLLGGRLLLTPGLRWDDHESFGTQLSPRLYALYKITDLLTLKAGYGQAFRAPTVKQVSEGYHATSGPHTFVGNPDLGPETSDTYECGVEYFGENLFARAMFFFNSIEDLITYEQLAVDNGRRTYRAVNLDEVETQGFETELGIGLSRNFFLSTAYTYLEAEDTQNGRRLEGKPRHSLNAKLKYTTSSKDLTAALRVQYIADQVLENGQDALEGVPDYALWHLSMRKTLWGGLEAQLGVENIGDVRLSEKSDLFAYEERGRLYYANLRYAF